MKQVIWAKAHKTRDSLSSSCLQVVLVYLQPFRHNIAHDVCPAAENRKKNIKTLHFGDSKSFKVIDVSTSKKLVTSVCCDKKHVCMCLSAIAFALDEPIAAK